MKYLLSFFESGFVTAPGEGFAPLVEGPGEASHHFRNFLY